MFDQKRQGATRQPHPNAPGLSGLQRRGHNKLNSDLFQRLYFSTSSRTALPDHTENQVGLRLAAQQSMKSFNQGLGYMKSEAPVPQKSHCTYSANFQQKGLEHVPVNNELRQLIATTSREGSAANKVIEGLASSSDTTNRASYGRYGEKKLLIERPSMIMPEQAIQVSRDAKFYESKSTFQRDFPLYDASSLRRSKAVQQSKSLDHLGQKSPGKLETSTSYQRGYGKEVGRYPGMPKVQSSCALSSSQYAAAFSGRL